MLRTNTRSEDIINTITEYTIDPQSKIEETTLYYYQTLEVGKHHTMDPIMEGIISCSLASSRGNPSCSVPKAEPRYRSCYMQRIVNMFYRLVSQVLYKL